METETPIECLTCWYSCQVNEIDECPLIQIQKDKTNMLWLKRITCWLTGHK